MINQLTQILPVSMHILDLYAQKDWNAEEFVTDETYLNVVI